MGLVYDHDPRTGLVVAHQGAEEASVRAALKQFDARLMLDYAIDTDWGCVVWQVLCRTGSDTPPLVVCRWRETDDPASKPLPLSHGLVEKAKRLHVESRAPKPDADADNAVLRARQNADADAELEEYAAELVDRLRERTLRSLPRGRYRRNTDFRDIRR